MSEFNYLTGRPELFENAPADALVVLEHEDGRLFYAIAHDLGAKYWNEDGSPGSKVGLIALHKKTRVIASRVRTGGLRPAEPKRDPIPKSRIERIQQAQNGLKKAISQPFPVAPKPEPKPAPVKIDPPKVAPKRKTPNVACPKCGVTGIHACMGAPVAWSEQDKQRLDDAVKQINAAETKPRIVAGDGFVSILDLANRSGCAVLTIYAKGTFMVTTAVASSGDRVDVQLDPKSGKIRVRKVEQGGAKLAGGQTFSCAGGARLFHFANGAKKVRIELTKVDGWWQGQAELAGVSK
ncbi:hypothetical protein [Pseudomonas sp.]|uniref:hypothetical protein n=1 Tax=Pseudomonas sp. TaxID=306 RepID=UPI002585DCD2|nr:hypothetical protein [Pseudomonas sp.]